MQAWIQTNGCSGYHVCSGAEITNYAQAGGFASWGYVSYSWFNTGSDGTHNPGGDKTGDCRAWTEETSTLNYKSAIMSMNTVDNTPYINIDYCRNTNRVLCCK